MAAAVISAKTSHRIMRPYTIGRLTGGAGYGHTSRPIVAAMSNIKACGIWRSAAKTAVFQARAGLRSALPATSAALVSIAA